MRKATSHLNGGKNQLVGTSPTGTGNSFKMSEDELKKAIESKVDKQDLINYHNIKSNKVDTENALRWIELLQKQIKHISVLFVEAIRSMNRNANETD